MISHALTIVVNEMSKHLADAYGNALPIPVHLGNLAEGFGGNASGGQVPRDSLVLSIVNIKEDKNLKNIPNYVRDDVTLTAQYQNPPIFLNLQVLVTATHGSYSDALLSLSRAIRFFQFRNVFTPENVAPASITTKQPLNVLDQLEVFKLVFDLYSPSMEEVNHLWGTLGGKQYPFVMYVLRMLDLKFKATPEAGSLILSVVRNIQHK